MFLSQVQTGGLEKLEKHIKKYRPDSFIKKGKEMAVDLKNFAKDKNVKYFMISYTDLFGGQRAKLVPTQAINEMQYEGAGFAGFSTYLDLTPAHPDMLAIPDTNAVIQLPWKRDVAWVPGNLMMNGETVDQAPRNVLNTLIKKSFN